MIEFVSTVAELICRYTIVEQLCIGSVSTAKQELQQALIQLYATILLSLSKAVACFSLNNAGRCCNTS
jgi:hypothetical protein